MLRVGMTVLDYGCGRGGDVRRLEALGYECNAYDPVYRPDGELRESDVVNLGYVVNVIEDAAERAATLRRAWDLATGVLIVSARLEREARDLRGAACEDGVLTGTGTFQKFYSQDSLRTWIEETLGVSGVAAAPGIFYLFRDPVEEQRFLLWRVTRPTRSRPRVSEALFEKHQDLLEALIGFVEDYGRLPRGDELSERNAIEDALGSLRRAFNVVKRVTGEERWDRVRLAHYEDVLVYLALARFGRRPQLSHLPQSLQYSVKDFFGSYKAACAQADRLLFAISESARVVAACNAARVGKRTPSALYLHTTALSDVAPILRVVDGCAKALVGTIPEATLVKFHLDRPRVSYLSYPQFESDAHPALSGGYIVDLDRLRVDYREYRDTTNPPVLHRKELFLSDWHPLRQKFARLTASEVRAGLYRDPSVIGTRRGWELVLENNGYALAGHRLIRRS